MRGGVLVWLALLAGALLLPTAAEARPFTDLTSLTPTNKEGQRLQQVRRGRDLTLVVGFRMTNAPLSAGYRVRISATLRRGDDKLVIKSKMAPVVYTGAYRFNLPLRIPRSFAPGNYRVLGLVEVLDDKRVVAKDTRLRDLKVL
jgi:hypothetical protein